METKITIKKYLGEKKAEILGICDQIIRDCDKVHIKAPVGTGKTSLMSNLIQENPDKQFIMLFPQISISEQVQGKLASMGIKSKVVNGSSLRLTIQTNSNEQTGFVDNIFLTTIDSASSLINALPFVKENTVVIVDETHTFLTSARENFTNTADTILRGGFPIIGLSATPSAWVSRFVFMIESFIDVTLEKHSPTIVHHTEVNKGALGTLALTIADSSDKLVVVFVESKKAQYRLKELIQQRAPKTICCLNADTKKTTEKVTWKYLMKHDKLPSDREVFILNSVVQAGINILNLDITKVYMFGEFDPFGFAQYLGRCRNYVEAYEYFHSPYSRQYEAFNEDSIQERTNLIKLFTTSSSENFLKVVRKLIPLMNDLIYDDGLSLLPNKCKIASSIYERLCGLSGTALISSIVDLFDDISFEESESLEGHVVTSAESHAIARKKAHKLLIDFIQENLSELMPLFASMKSDFSEPSMESTIEAKYVGILKKVHPILYNKMTGLMRTMKTAQISPKRLFAATHLYRQSHKSLEVLTEYLGLNNNTARDIAETIDYFQIYKKSNPIIKKAIKVVGSEIEELKSADEWREVIIESLPIISTSEKLTEGFYKFSLQKQRSNGKLKLVGFNHCLNDYVKRLNLKHITVHNNRICPK